MNVFSFIFCVVFAFLRLGAKPYSIKRQTWPIFRPLAFNNRTNRSIEAKTDGEFTLCSCLVAKLINILINTLLSPCPLNIENVFLSTSVAAVTSAFDVFCLTWFSLTVLYNQLLFFSPLKDFWKDYLDAVSLVLMLGDSITFNHFKLIGNLVGKFHLMTLWQLTPKYIFQQKFQMPKILRQSVVFLPPSPCMLHKFCMSNIFSKDQSRFGQFSLWTKSYSRGNRFGREIRWWGKFWGVQKVTKSSSNLVKLKFRVWKTPKIFRNYIWYEKLEKTFWWRKSWVGGRYKVRCKRLKRQSRVTL